MIIENQDGKWKKSKTTLIRRNCSIPLEHDKGQDFEMMLGMYDGDFAMIHENENSVYAAVDRIRSIPVFYMCYNHVFYISDSIVALALKRETIACNQRAVRELKEAAYVTGHETLIADIYSLLPGEYIRYDKAANTYQVKEYFDYGKAKPILQTESELIERMQGLHSTVFRELIDDVGGRQIVIPLSGGYDSRLILHMLCTLGYKNIVCFTYGKEHNAESAVSKRIAGTYRVPWKFVRYTPEKIKRMMQSEGYKNYLCMSCKGISASHIQDFLAVAELKEKGLVEEDAVFVPGHAYDFLAGTHISNGLSGLGEMVSKQMVTSEIITKHYTHIKRREKGREEWISKELGEEAAFHNSVGMYHFWEWKERQAKYIANSVRVYEYFGYEWKLPFWDRRLIEFWDRISVELRKDRFLFLQYMEKIGLKSDSSNDRKFAGARSRIPFRVRMFLYRIKDLMNNPLEFYSVFNLREKLRFLSGIWDFQEKIVEDDLKYFFEAVRIEEDRNV